MDGSSFFASFKAASSSVKEIIQFNSGAIDSFPIKGSEVRPFFKKFQIFPIINWSPC